MGFSLTFVRIEVDKAVDADREGIAAFLRAHDLQLASSDDDAHHLTGATGLLAFDGRWTDLHLSSLDQAKPVDGGIWHATLSQQECAFVYGLCIAGRMLVLNPQGSPSIVVPGSNHDAANLPAEMLDDIAWVDSPEEMHQVLSGGFERFLRYRDRVVGERARHDE